jgi:hypothetical protein
VILVQEADDDDKAREKERPLFETVLFVGENNNPFSREVGTRVYLLKGAKVDINHIIADDMAEYKNR